MKQVNRIRRYYIIMELREMGLTLEDIGAQFKLSRERVRQIIAKPPKNARLPKEAAFVDTTPGQRIAHFQTQAVKRHAQSLLNQAVNRGDINKPEICQHCFDQSKLNGHHPDYSQPLDVIWLCHACHVDEHKRLGTRYGTTPK